MFSCCGVIAARPRECCFEGGWNGCFHFTSLYDDYGTKFPNDDVARFSVYDSTSEASETHEHATKWSIYPALLALRVPFPCSFAGTLSVFSRNDERGTLLFLVTRTKRSPRLPPRCENLPPESGASCENQLCRSLTVLFTKRSYSASGH
jgi:hypothetical protein